MPKEYFRYYPDIDDPDFLKKIYEKKIQFYIHRQKDLSKKTLEELCPVFEVKQELLSQQALLKNFISPETPYKNLLIFHGTGVGKTCTGIQIAEGFKDHLQKNNGMAYILGSGDAINNFAEALMGPCTKYHYRSIEEKNYLRHLENTNTEDSLEKKNEN